MDDDAEPAAALAVSATLDLFPMRPMSACASETPACSLPRPRSVPSLHNSGSRSPHGTPLEPLIGAVIGGESLTLCPSGGSPKACRLLGARRQMSEVNLRRRTAVHSASFLAPSMSPTSWKISKETKETPGFDMQGASTLPGPPWMTMPGRDPPSLPPLVASGGKKVVRMNNDVDFIGTAGDTVKMRPLSDVQRPCSAHVGPAETRISPSRRARGETRFGRPLTAKARFASSRASSPFGIDPKHLTASGLPAGVMQDQINPYIPYSGFPTLSYLRGF